MDFDIFLELERRRLEEERERLSAGNSFSVQEDSSVSKLTDCVQPNIKPTEIYIIKAKNLTNEQANLDNKSEAYNNNVLKTSTRYNENSTSDLYETIFQQATNNCETNGYNEKSEKFYIHQLPENETENAIKADRRNLLEIDSGMIEISSNNSLSKNAKDWANQKESNHRLVEKVRKQRKDDMEQWVSDTFYSYFPGFNNEYQKRQNILRERLQENQDNFLKHIASQAPKNGLKKFRKYQQDNLIAKSNLSSSTTRTTSTTTTSTDSKRKSPRLLNDKTDLEIIVNNPNYLSSSNQEPKSRPGTTRYKLLQDLQHTDFATDMLSYDDKYHNSNINERQRHHSEESERKKDYQRELLQQIEEKRRSIELLREKERRQDEALTRRLQEQLKTIHLEERLEKERLEAERLRFDTEQNRLKRENLLAKLDEDAKLLHMKTMKKSKVSTTNNDNPSSNESNNKIYKYFSNSARHEYRRGCPLEIDFDLDIPENLNDSHTERECFHLTEKVCPMCDAPLKNFESCCLRCQKKLSLKLNYKKTKEKSSIDVSNMENGNKDDKNELTQNEEVLKSDMHENTIAEEDGEVNGDDNEEDDEELNLQSTYSLVCTKCERLYTLCPNCLSKSDVCKACNRKRHVCMSCRRALCSFCLDEVACGRDTERSHINDRNKRDGRKQDSERSFQVLEVNYAKEFLDDDDLSSSSMPINKNENNINVESSHINNNNDKIIKSFPSAYSEQIHNNLNSDKAEVRPPYSTNIERNSIFHPNYSPVRQIKSPAFEQLSKIVDKQLTFDLDTSPIDDPNTIEKVRKETDKRLSRYLKNYGDLAKYQRSKSESRNFGTQTTPESIGRRDVVLMEENNLSMPLLRDMPKMTRKESTNLMSKVMTNNQRKMENLKNRWEVPAVQKFTVSSTSPRVLTQVGAIRKQLQTERFLAESNLNDHLNSY